MKAKVTVTFVLSAPTLDRIKTFTRAVEQFIKSVALYDTKLESLSSDIEEIE